MVVLRSRTVASPAQPSDTLKGEAVQSTTPATSYELSLNHRPSLESVESESKLINSAEGRIIGVSSSGKALRRSLRFTSKSSQSSECNGVSSTANEVSTTVENTFVNLDSGAANEKAVRNSVSEVFSLENGDSSDLVLSDGFELGDMLVNTNQSVAKRKRSELDTALVILDLDNHGNSLHYTESAIPEVDNHGNSPGDSNFHANSSHNVRSNEDSVAERGQLRMQDNEQLNSHRRAAAHFARFNEEEGGEEEGGGYSSDRARREVESVERTEAFEDWPGPFATAMKIIRDRQRKLPKNISSDRDECIPIPWSPRGNKKLCVKRSPSSLQEMCLTILVQNAEAISSLEYVPDETRHKMSQLLCDSRKMTARFFALLLSGSSTEVRIKDCSWLSEDQFTNSFQNCDTSKLMVLQLDQCGRCMPDYVIQSVLGGSSKGFPALSAISLKGACRLSDIGLRVLVQAAPVLKSINLSLCSLLTSDSIAILAEALGSSLKELYIDNCLNIDAMCIVDSLAKLKTLELLSLAGIHTVTDQFIGKFFVGRSRNMKELVLADCVNLTDSSLKIISDACSSIEALNISNLHKLTDLSIGYLSNGCRSIRRLVLCRNEFSDEAVAAFLETCGQSLVELSLNNVKATGHNSALSLAKHSRKLEVLDLSWCRKLGDNALGLIVDSCLNLKKLKLFGCSQLTDVFLHGHSNELVNIIGLKMCKLLEHMY